jgi:hypothetical protein
MAKKLILDDVENLAISPSAELTLAQNNRRIENAFQGVVSRDGTTPNFMEADFDVNGYRILNLPDPTEDTDPIRLGDVSGLIETIDIRTNPLTDDMEFRRTGSTDWVVLYTAAELTGPTGADGADGADGATGTGSGDLLAANNLSDVASALTSRSNLGLEIDVDVAAYNAFRNGLTTFGVAAGEITEGNDSRFTQIAVETITASYSPVVGDSGKTIVSDSLTTDPAIDITYDTTLPTGFTQVLYCPVAKQEFSLLAGAGASIHVIGEATPRDLKVLTTGLATIIKVNATDFAVSGVSLGTV